MKAVDYHKLPALSASLIKTILQKSCAHARLQQTEPRDEPSAAMLQGTAAHAVILENRDDIVMVIDANDYRTKVAQEAKHEALAADKVPILAGKADEFFYMCQTAREQIQNILGIDLAADGKAEATLTWSEGDLPLKSRLDWLQNERNFILDLKMTELSSPYTFMRSIASSGYDIQDAMYRRAVNKTSGNQARFIFCVCEAIAPYSVYFLELSPAFQAIGEAKVERGIQLWKACVESGIYPGYSQEIQRVEPPAWELAAAEELHYEAEGFSVEAFLFGSVKEPKK